MKKIILLAAVAALACSSCTKEIDGQISTGRMVEKVFTANLDQTRALVDGNIVKWEVGDKIGVLCDSSTEVCEFTVSAADGATCTFIGAAPEEATQFAAVYPLSAAVSATFTPAVTVKCTIPAIQTVGANMVDPEALVCCAVGEGTSFSFKNAFSLVKVTVPMDGVKSIQIRNIANTGMAGTVTVDFADLSTIAATTYPMVKLYAKDGETLQKDQAYYLAAAPCELTEGLGVAMATAEDTYAQKSATVATLARNGQIVIKNLSLTKLLKEIATKADLIAFGQAAKLYDEDVEVKLTADIDLEEEEWTPIEQFIGSFDGQCHRIYNLKITTAPAYTGLFHTVGSNLSTPAYLKNLCVGSKDFDFSTKVGTYDGKSMVEFNATDDSMWEYAAGLVGYLHTGATIEHCVNYVPVTVNAAATTRYRLGGIAGTMKADTTIKDCANHANITSAATTPTTAAYTQAIGGIVGSMDGANASILNCFNYGDMKNLSTFTDHVGGIAGSCSYVGEITECTNYGAVENAAASYNTSTGYAVRVGGIIGSANGSPLVITKCTNSGPVTQSVCPNQRSVGIGGIVGVAGNSVVIKGCSNSGTPAFTAAGVSGTGMCIGGIIGYTTGASYTTTITKADDGTPTTNTAQVVLQQDMAGTTYFGGIAGHINQNPATSVIEYCENSGKIAGSSKLTTTISFALGGISGCTKGSVYHCTNTGLVQSSDNNNSTTFYVGGIVGNGNAIVEISDCANTATYIQMGKGKASKMYFGGICGAGKAFDTVMKNCTNTCELRTSRGNTVYAGGLVGFLSMTSDTVTAATNFEGCTVKYLNNASTVSRTNGQVGMLFGGLTGTPAGTLTIGSAASPCKVGGTWQDYTTKEATNITAENILTYLVGSLAANQTVLSENVVTTNIQLAE